MQPTSAALPIEWRDCSGGIRGRLGVDAARFLDGASRDGNSVGRGREGAAAPGRTFFGVTINVCHQGPRNGESREPFPPIRRRRFGAARGVSTTSAHVSIHMPIAREARGMGGDGGRAIPELGYLPHARANRRSPRASKEGEAPGRSQKREVFLCPLLHYSTPATKVAASREGRRLGELRLAPATTEILRLPIAPRTSPPRIFFLPIRSTWFLIGATLTRPRRYLPRAEQTGVTASRPR